MDNIWEQIAKLKGLELGEEFRFKNAQSTYKFTTTGLLCTLNSGICKKSEMYLNDINKEIEKLPWKPKFGEKYWAPDILCADEAEDYVNKENGHDERVISAGLAFKTSGEAIEAHRKIMKFIEGGGLRVERCIA